MAIVIESKTVTSGPQQNVSGTSDNVGFFPYGWPAYSAIQPGWTCVQTGAVVTAVDGVYHVITTVGTPFASGSHYSFTSPIGVTIGNGITFSSGPTPNISIAPWDITNRGGMGGGVTYVGTPLSLESWTVDIGTTIASAIYFEATDAPTLAIWLGKFASAGFNTNYTYAYNATWGAGSTTVNTVVRVGVGIAGTNTGDPNLMKIIPIDTTVTGWETSSVFSTLALPGTYNFPVALTPYSPDTQMGNDWN